MASDSEFERLLHTILDHQLLCHPLPWVVERDWSYEVIASDKAIVAKCMSQEEADAVVAYAQRREAEHVKNSQEVEEWLESLGSPNTLAM